MQFKKSMKAIACTALLSSLLAGCQTEVSEPQSFSRFEPKNNRVLVFAGQNLAATRAYYALESVPKPAGFTDYISYQLGNQYPEFAPDFPTSYEGNDGLFEATNWGGGEQCTDCLLHEPGYEQAAIAIGMYIGGPLGAQGEQGEVCTAQPHCNVARIARGELDSQLNTFADWLLGLGQRPVFLRIGYEFDGAWNGYDPAQYREAFKYIRRFLDGKGVTNVAYVMQSFGYASYETMQAYYPAPDDQYESYVDWIGYSYFTNDAQAPGINELKFARDHGMKAFIAEVTPHTGDCARQIDISTNAPLAREWIDNFFDHVEANRDVVRAVAYINARWNDADYSPMWSVQQDHNCPGYFANSNARLNDAPTIADYWGEKISQPYFLNDSKNLLSELKQ